MRVKNFTGKLHFTNTNLSGNSENSAMFYGGRKELFV
jgi:hypothetical protein